MRRVCSLHIVDVSLFVEKDGRERLKSFMIKKLQRALKPGIILTPAILALAWGLFTGFTSHTVVFQSSAPGIIAHYLSGQSTATGYLQMMGGSELYVVDEHAFTPVLHGVQTLENGDAISFVFESNQSTPIDVRSHTGTHLVGSAHRIVEITFYGAQQVTVYKTMEYAHHPQGYYQNNWLPGGALALGGLVWLAVAFLFRRRLDLILKHSSNTANSTGISGYRETDKLLSEQQIATGNREERDEFENIGQTMPHTTLPLAGKTLSLPSVTAKVATTTTSLTTPSLISLPAIHPASSGSTVEKNQVPQSTHSLPAMPPVQPMEQSIPAPDSLLQSTGQFKRPLLPASTTRLPALNLPSTQPSVSQTSSEHEKPAS